jgi:hypothetical protein
MHKIREFTRTAVCAQQKSGQIRSEKRRDGTRGEQKKQASYHHPPGVDRIVE